MAVAGVLAVADIRYDEQVGGLSPDGADGGLDDPVVGISPRRLLVLAFGQPEKDHAANSQIFYFLALPN